MDPQQLPATIARAKAGDTQAFEELLDAYNKRLYGYFVRATGNHHEAEDLLSEVMLKLVRTLKKYDEKGRFEPWLFRIAANLVRDRIRRKKVRPKSMSLSADDGEGPSFAAELPADGPGVDAEMLTAEASEQVQAALETLDETTRQMILLRHFGEMSFKEIARTFDCPLGTALARVHRGLGKLRSYLSAE